MMPATRHDRLRRRDVRRRRRGWLRAVATTAGVLMVGGVAVGAVVFLLKTTRPDAPVQLGCTVALDEGQWRMSLDQADNAALITAVTVRRDLPARAATIGLATALQESRLVNIDYGDRDSVGLFQQRTSQGWGTVEEIMDPVYSTNAFFDGLVKVAGYTELPVTEAAQAVQRSGFPDAYAQHENRSRAWASALTGHSRAAVTCTTADPAQVSAEDPAALDAALTTLEDRIRRDFGDLQMTRTGGGDILVDVSPLGPDSDRLAWALGQWAVATASVTGVEDVYVGTQVWSRNSSGWATADSDTPLEAQQVHLRLALEE